MITINKPLVLITGGAGFIGSHVVDALLQRDYRVRVVDDFSTGSRQNLAHHSAHPELEVYQASVLDEQAMQELHDGVHFVMHLATRNVRLSLRQPTLVHDVNTSGTLNVLKAAAAARVSRFLYCSSSEVNGTAELVPMPEDYHFRPETIYGASKLAGEYYTLAFHRSAWLSTVIARPHNNYGPRSHFGGNSGEVIPRFILSAFANQPLRIYGDGRQTRDFTYVTETADFLVRLLESPLTSGNTYNVCLGQEVTIREVAENILAQTASVSPLVYLPTRPSDVLRLCGDPTRLRQTLHSSPSISLAEGLEQTISWFREHIALTPEILRNLASNNWQGDSESWIPSSFQPKVSHV